MAELYGWRVDFVAIVRFSSDERPDILCISFLLHRSTLLSTIHSHCFSSYGTLSPLPKKTPVRHSTKIDRTYTFVIVLPINWVTRLSSNVADRCI